MNRWRTFNIRLQSRRPRVAVELLPARSMDWSPNVHLLPGSAYQALGIMEELWVLCRNMGDVSTLTGEQEMRQRVDEFLYESHTKPMRSVGQDFENSVHSFPVGNFLVSWCPVSAISSVSVKKVQGNKLRVRRK